jgi:hypothetical protein
MDIAQKMIFLESLGNFFKENLRKGSSHAVRHQEAIEKFLDKLSPFPSQVFIDLPKYSDNLRNGWTTTLLEAKEALEKSIEIAKNECPIGEFGVDISDSALNLSDVCYLLAECRKSDKYKYFEIPEEGVVKFIKTPEAEKQDELEGKEAEEEVKEIPEEVKDIVNLRQLAKTYRDLGLKLIEARDELNENYPVIAETNLTDPSKLNNEYVRDILEMQECHNLASITRLTTKLQTDEELDTYKVDKKTDFNSGEVISLLRSFILESRFFTFGYESQGATPICRIHRYLQLNLASYVQRCVVDFPEIEKIEEPTEEQQQELEEDKAWIEFDARKPTASLFSQDLFIWSKKIKPIAEGEENNE